MTKIPSQSEIDIHWRAVPSLREIWAEERQRMALLLPPKENFLSGDNGDLSFTLSVKKGAPIPGSQLAVDGNKRLFDSSPMLKSDFQRAMNDIVEKYGSVLDTLNARLQEQKEKENMSKHNITMDENKKQQDLSSILSQKDEALSALEGLLDQFSNENDYTHKDCDLEPGNDGYDNSSALLYTPTKSFGFSQLQSGRRNEGNIDSPGFLHTPTKSFGYSQSQLGRGHERSGDSYGLLYTPTKSFRLSQLQSPALSLTQVEHKEVQDNLDFCMEVDRLDSGLIEEIDPNTLTPFDGVNEDNILDEEENMQEEEFEKSLTMLATQTFQTIEETFSQLDSVVNTVASSQSTFDGLALGQNSISSGDQIKSLSPNIQEREFETPPVHKKILSLLSSDSPSFGIKSGDFLELKERPPNKSVFDETSSQIRLYPYNQNHTMPVSWLGYSSSSNKMNSMPYDYSGIFIQPVAAPPSSAKVRKWVERKRRSKEAKLPHSIKTQERNNSNALEFDPNSRKLLRVNKTKRKRKVAFSNDTVISSSKVCFVEEVIWEEGNQDMTQESSGTSSSQGKESGSIEDNDEILMQSIQQDGKNKTEITPISPFTAHSDSLDTMDPLQGIGQQGGRIYVEGGGLKASVTADNRRSQKKLSMMSIEVHVQCRIGKAGVNDSTEIAMRPDPARDSISAVMYVYAFDPGGGEKIEIKERGCVFIPTENEINSYQKTEDSQITSSLISKIGKTMGISSKMKIEAVSDERKLLLRISSIVQWKDPDSLMSWDTQAGGLGYLIDRGLSLGKSENDKSKKLGKLDMVRLLGRTPKQKSKDDGERDSLMSKSESKETSEFAGSVLGADWDDRVGAGAGPSSIVSLFTKL